MRFYYNISLAICAEEQWVIDYIFNCDEELTKEEIQEELRSRFQYEGWFECEVSNTIEEQMNKYYGVV